jgi:hypothetical protein
MSLSIDHLTSRLLNIAFLELAHAAGSNGEITFSAYRGGGLKWQPPFCSLQA